jgi:hypothetical protein
VLAHVWREHAQSNRPDRIGLRPSQGKTDGPRKKTASVAARDLGEQPDAGRPTLDAGVPLLFQQAHPAAGHRAAYIAPPNE